MLICPIDINFWAWFKYSMAIKNTSKEIPNTCLPAGKAENRVPNVVKTAFTLLSTFVAVGGDFAS
jgi:hypothetical protein